MSSDIERMEKDRLLQLMAQEHARMEQLLATLSEEQMTRPRVYDELSAKDVLAHIAAWGRMQADWIGRSMRGEQVVRYSPDFRLTGDDARDEQVMDSLNEKVFRENKDKPLPEVLADFRAAHSELVQTVLGMSDEELNDPNRFEWWPGDPVWHNIAGNSYEHYKEHRELIEDWLKRGNAAKRV
jgi:hypothetical protein